MTLPIDRTAKAALDANLVNGNTSDAPKQKASNDVVYNTIDELNTKVDNHAGAATLPHADGCVTTAKLADGSITEPKYATGSVSSRAIANGAVGVNQLATGLAASADVNAQFAKRGIDVTSAPYNAKGDGVTDDSAAIQSAINALGTTGGRILFPPGSFLLGTPLSLSVSIKPIEFIGAGWSYDNGQASRIVVKSAINAFTISNGSNGHAWRDLNFYGTDVGLKAIDGTFGNKLRITNCYITNFVNALYLKQGLCVVKDSYFKANTGDAVTINSDTWVDGNEMASNGGCGLKVLSGGNRINNNLLNTNSSHGIHVDGTGAGANISINDISHNYIGNNTGYNIFMEGVNFNGNAGIISENYVQQVTAYIAGGIKLKSCRNIVVANNVILGAGNTSFKTDLEGIVLDACTYITLADNNFQFVTKEDILLSACNDCIVSGVMSYNHANSATPAANLFSIRAIGGNRNQLNNIRIADLRGGGAVSKGIEITDANTIVSNYYPYGVTDSFGTSKVSYFDVNSNISKQSGMYLIDNVLAFRGTATVSRIIQVGTGSPEGVVSARIGSLYMREDGGAGTSFYVKESGTGNTGWIAK